jgi:hypothetical protein
MKRKACDSEYYRVRSRGGGRWREEFPEDDPKDDERSAARVAAMHEDFKQRMAVLEAAEAGAKERRKQDATEHSFRSNALVAWAEYRAAGVEPPRLTADGVPAFSLSLLFVLGWTIEEIDGKRLLLKPVHAKADQQRAKMENSLKESF